jgi:hypothetical protein
MNERKRKCVIKMDNYSPIMNDPIMLHAEKWVEFGVIIMITISQSQKAKNHMLLIRCGFWAYSEYDDNMVTEV